MTSMGSHRLLHVRGLTVRFERGERVVTAVEGVDLDVMAGEVVGLVGESGCGKSVTARALLGLLPSPPADTEAEVVEICSTPTLGLGERELSRIRGRLVGMVFQEPMTALNPVVRIGTQLTEGPRRHLGLSRREARARAVELLRSVGIPEPEARLAAYPHQLSGGMRQRVMIAAALSSDPELLIADEPTTALDVTVQARILGLLERIRRERGLGLLLITHDLAVVAQVAHRVVVLYAGQVVEEAPVEVLFDRPGHPYTLGLLLSIPRLAEPGAEPRRGPLPTMPGQVPAPGDWPDGCRFHPRCPWAGDDCRAGPVPIVELGPGHRVRCLRPVEGEAWPET